MMDGINRSNGSILGAFTARSQPARVDGGAASVRAAAPARPAAGTLVKELASAPPVNAVRVAQLQAEIAGGRFTVDPDAIAAAMLRLDRGRA
jgi:flagellar biosynthesis anti-sigma factor FlgM